MDKLDYRDEQMSSRFLYTYLSWGSSKPDAEVRIPVKMIY